MNTPGLHQTILHKESDCSFHCLCVKMNHNLESETSRGVDYGENSVGFAIRSPSVLQARLCWPWDLRQATQGFRIRFCTSALCEAAIRS